jgi:hypothetical protein
MPTTSRTWKERPCLGLFSNEPESTEYADFMLVIERFCR